MSSIYVQIGQCGCQIGSKLNKQLSFSYYSTRTNSNKLHAIMIDTEPKVLKPFIDHPPKWLDVRNVKFFQYGRGNNWSYGYMHELPRRNVETEFVGGFKQYSHLTKQEKQLREQQKQGNQDPQDDQEQHITRGKSPNIAQKFENKKPKWNSNNKLEEDYVENHVEDHPALTEFEEKVLVGKYIKENRQIGEYTLGRIRKQLESMDCPMAINVLCSLGGGTGSGLGTKIIQQIYQHFNMDILAHVVLPNKSGQTPLQIYNCTLSLSQIQEHSTAIFTYYNDKMINTFLTQKDKQKQKDIIGPKGNDLDLINENIAEMQTRLFMINQHHHYNRFYTDLVNQCVLSPQLKYLALFGVKNGISLAKDQSVSQSLIDPAFQALCHQLRVYNEEIYHIEEVEVRRQKCLANQMLIMAPPEHQLEQAHKKKLRNILNPAPINPQLNIEYIEMPKKQTNSQLNASKASTGTNSSQSNKPQILLLANHSNINRYLEYLSVAGRKKYNAKAYLWHYKYADLETAFDNIENVIDQYYYSAHHS